MTTTPGFLTFTSSEGVLKCNGKRINIKGVNWFGMETDTFSLHGLWSVGFDSLLKFLVNNKFNAIRLPVSVDFVEGMDTINATTIVPGPNSDLVTSTGQPLKCGVFLDKIMAKFAAAGILVMLDMHLLKAHTAITDLWYDAAYSEQRVTNAWGVLVKRYAKFWNFFAADLKNEPHGSASWGDNNAATDWAAAAERIGNAILDICPRLLIFVEGVDGRDKADSWWGGYLGFIRHNNRPIKLKVPDRLVYSPHVYGPSVWPKKMFQVREFPFNMPPQWEEQWGFLKKTPGAAICLGEWGGQATNTGEGTAQYRPDLTWQRAIAEWLALNDIRDTFYWALNPNSGDTLGLVKQDWVTPEDEKLRIIAYVCPNPTSFAGGIPVTPTLTGTTLPPWTSVLPGVKPMITSTGTPATPPPDSSASYSVSVVVKVIDSWAENGALVYRCDVTITNNSTSVLGASFQVGEMVTGAVITQLWSMIKLGDGELWSLPAWILDQGGLKVGQSHTFGCCSRGAKPDFRVIARG